MLKKYSGISFNQELNCSVYLGRKYLLIFKDNTNPLTDIPFKAIEIEKIKKKESFEKNKPISGLRLSMKSSYPFFSEKFILSGNQNQIDNLQSQIDSLIQGETKIFSSSQLKLP
ncbi:hypothetical protein EDI_077060 [Entamoeba dispar SAW760]|uniref:Uncharacterized protein n=1 Tax=Entamoeba dispar (strain ATCC PRA-260 / SAW760) TaxID=370354 RepID=B0EIU5_ENTDS|nr:uncharacterized protein EDI_077060 [Entamoeba dispar SAW760]EDR25547.1 hypothetical protein EDI_077060 [Entamoeba dispar SAW760]|eukprot:EDR25547.1 hypothetical protein EDI_077060 [Entamoeba dispar SAW760]